MRTSSRSFVARLAIATLFLLALLPGSSAAAAQSAETSYTDEDYGVTIGWTDQWEAQLPSAESPILSLERDSSVIVIISILDGQLVPPEDAVWFLYEEGDEIVEDRTTDNPPHLTMTMEEAGMTYTVEAYAVNDGEATVLVSVGTVPVLQSSAVEIMQEDITVNGSAVMTGQPIEGSGEAVDEATPETETRTSRTSRESTEPAEATAEATEETDRVTRTSRGTSETPDATETETAEPTEEIVRTSRTGSDETETPEATEAPTTEPTETTEVGTEPIEIATEEPTEEVVEADDPGSFTGPVWGYSFTYDTAMWEQSDSFENPVVDGVRLDAASSTVVFMGTSDYGADPVGCLVGEDEYFSSESDSISDWELTTDANGDPLWYESDELAWGVFSYTFHSSSGADVEFVDYVSCETIPGEDAVLIVQMTSFPDEYNDNLDAVLDILDTLEFQP